MRPEPCEVQGSPAPHVVRGRIAECFVGEIRGFPPPLKKGGVKNHILFVSPVKTGVQSIWSPMKTLDSGWSLPRT